MKRDRLKICFSEKKREHALKVLEKEDAILPKSTVLRCRVRYFTDGAILGSQEYVRGFIDLWQMEKGRKYPPKANPMRGTDWGGLLLRASEKRIMLREV